MRMRLGGRFTCPVRGCQEVVNELDSGGAAGDVVHEVSGSGGRRKREIDKRRGRVDFARPEIHQ